MLGIKISLQQGLRLIKDSYKDRKIQQVGDEMEPYFPYCSAQRGNLTQALSTSLKQECSLVPGSNMAHCLLCNISWVT